MEDLVLLLTLTVFFVVFTLVLVFFVRYEVDQAVLTIDDKISNKLKTFNATLRGRRKQEREPSNMDYLIEAAQTMIAMKQQGISVKDILAEFGGLAKDEIVNELTDQSKDS